MLPRCSRVRELWNRRTRQDATDRWLPDPHKDFSKLPQSLLKRFTAKTVRGMILTRVSRIVFW